MRNHFVSFVLNEDNEVIELDGMRDGGPKKISGFEKKKNYCKEIN